MYWNQDELTMHWLKDFLQGPQPPSEIPFWRAAMSTVDSGVVAGAARAVAAKAMAERMTEIFMLGGGRCEPGLDVEVSCGDGRISDNLSVESSVVVAG